ncbi:MULTISPECIES: TRM11 family SAM-dependent methyltransferase [unclassified Carboxylicivirga]|uniref:TRM11 family SAM-dependent methyltransferase n=1 Tax=Carboxylicivirga TaxID=1628153 RepID=UPI003D325697
MLHRFIYTFKYDTHNAHLCQLESRQLFGEGAAKKMLITDIEIDPSISPFIKNRFEVLESANEYTALLEKVRQRAMEQDGFKAEYLILHGDTTPYDIRLSKLKDIGYAIKGDPDYTNPEIIYSVCFYNSTWHFGILTKHNTQWFKHKNKPESFSCAINMDIAKTLVSLASKGDTNKRLLDAGCGVGTVMLEACIAGFDIEGCDIHWKACVATRKNLAHYGYSANVYRSDLKDHLNKYDSAIVDLPYNVFSHSNDDNALHIIRSAARLANRLIVVSTTDINELIHQAELRLLDSCKVEKKGKLFSRNIWVCERN